MAERRKPTSTSNFGAGRRESHDASDFYARFSPPKLSDDEHVNPPAAVDELYLGDSRAMDPVASASVALVVTSPPYFAGKAYEEELGEGHIPANYFDYLQMLTDVFAECVDKLEPGGRIAVNVANLGRKPYRSLAADVTTILQDRLGLLLRGEVVWWKARGAGGSCAWGSYRKPANPVLRDLTERVVIASKGRFDRAVPGPRRAKSGLPAHATIGAEEFMEATLDVWDIPPESATRVGHPAPFPVELPQRVIELYTYEGDLVLDPFMGSGSTAVAAVRTGRHFVGFDMDPAYVEIARERIAAEGASGARGARPADGEDVPGDEGAAAVDVAAHLLTAAGFTTVRKPAKNSLSNGVVLRAADARGGAWNVVISGGFTVAAAGLRRAEETWRVLGQAYAVRAAEPEARVLVLTTELPTRSSPSGKALAAATGDTVTAVLEFDDPGLPARLAELATGAE